MAIAVPNYGNLIIKEESCTNIKFDQYILLNEVKVCDTNARRFDITYLEEK